MHMSALTTPLRDLDLLETGKRELAGEWVVGTDVWKRLKADRRIRQDNERRRRQGFSKPSELPDPPRQQNGHAGADPAGTDMDVDNESVGTTRRPGTDGERVIYYIHGGAYYVGNAATHRLITIGVSKACNARVFGGSLAFLDTQAHWSRSYHLSAGTRTPFPPPPA